MSESVEERMPWMFLDGEIIQITIGHRMVTDQGRALQAVRDQTAHCTLPERWVVQRAVESANACGVQFQRGCFTAEATQNTLHDVSRRMINAMLLFYGMALGACRIQEAQREEEEQG